MKKVIMISGANRGIGKAIALNLYKHGFLLSLGIRDLTTIDADILRLEKNEVLLASYNTDNPTTESEWIQKTYGAFNRIDGLINNAGIYYSLDIEDDDEEMLDEMLNVNTKAPMRLTRFQR